MMSFLRFSIGIVFASFAAAALAAGPLAGQVPPKPKPPLTFEVHAPLDLAFCVNCARLDVRIFSLPGDGCLHCEDLATYLNTYAFIDPDLYVKNLGTLPSLPGTVTLQWYDLVNKGPATVTVAIPAVAPGAWEAAPIPNTHIIFKKEEGVKLTIAYSDANGARHRVRTVRKCPDN